MPEKMCSGITVTLCQDGIIEMIMDCPSNNLMTGQFMDELEIAIQQCKNIAEQNQVKGLIIGAKGRHFSSGADVAALMERYTDSAAQKDEDGVLLGLKQQKSALMALNQFAFPTVAAVSGFCTGSGSEIALHCHYRICEDNVRIGQPESTFGILPALGGIVRTAQYCGLQNAVEFVLTGSMFQADKALECGWADMVVAKKQSLDTARRLIHYLNEHKESCQGKTRKECVLSFEQA